MKTSRRARAGRDVTETHATLLTANHRDRIVEDGILGQLDRMRSYHTEDGASLHCQLRMSKGAFRSGERVEISARSIKNAVADANRHRLRGHFALVDDNTPDDAVLDQKQSLR